MQEVGGIGQIHSGAGSHRKEQVRSAAEVQGCREPCLVGDDRSLVDNMAWALVHDGRKSRERQGGLVAGRKCMVWCLQNSPSLAPPLHCRKPWQNLLERWGNARAR